MTDVVERLRKAAVEPCGGCCYGESMELAADHIESQQKTMEELRANNGVRLLATWAEIMPKAPDDFPIPNNVSHITLTMKHARDLHALLWPDRTLATLAKAGEA